MPRWMPDWEAMLAAAPEIDLGGRSGDVYVIADAHLGDARARPEAFQAMLERLPGPRAVVFLGDLFKVWLALPKFWSPPVRATLAGFQRLRAAGVPIVFVVGNREFMLPRSQAEAQRRGLPFDHIVPGMAVLRCGGARYGLTHGDVINRHDTRYLLWRHWSRSRPVRALLHAVPGGPARRWAERTEVAMSRANRPIKIRFPTGEVQAFADAMASSGAAGPLDGFLIGHFHRDNRFSGAGRPDFLRIVPDWFSRKQVLRLDGAGRQEVLSFAEAPAAAEAGPADA